MMLYLLLFFSFNQATLPYEFLNCKQQEIKKNTYLLKDKKRTFHVICDPEEHYVKPFRSTDSIIVIDGKYDLFVYAYIEGAPEKAWFRIAGQPRTKKENHRHYYGPWTKAQFRKKILPKLHPNPPEAMTPKQLWKQLKKEDKKKAQN